MNKKCEIDVLWVCLYVAGCGGCWREDEFILFSVLIVLLCSCGVNEREWFKLA